MNEYLGNRDEYLPGGYPSRSMCDVLHELRTYAGLYPQHVHVCGLVEEAQTIANRMEAGLSDKKDYYSLVRELRKRIKKIRFPNKGDKDE